MKDKIIGWAGFGKATVVMSVSSLVIRITNKLLVDHFKVMSETHISDFWVMTIGFIIFVCLWYYFDRDFKDKWRE